MYFNITSCTLYWGISTGVFQGLYLQLARDHVKIYILCKYIPSTLHGGAEICVLTTPWFHYWS